MEREFLCSMCGGMTPLIKKTDFLENDIRHEYAECQKCKGKVTFYYSDKKLRNMLFKQSHTKTQAKKVKLAAEIQQKMDELRNLYEMR